MSRMDIDDPFVMKVVVTIAGIVLGGMALEWLWNPDTEAWGAFELIGFLVAAAAAGVMIAARRLRD